MTKDEQIKQKLTTLFGELIGDFSVEQKDGRIMIHVKQFADLGLDKKEMQKLFANALNVEPETLSID